MRTLAKALGQNEDLLASFVSVLRRVQTTHGQAASGLQRIESTLFRRRQRLAASTQRLGAQGAAILHLELTDSDEDLERSIDRLLERGLPALGLLVRASGVVKIDADTKQQLSWIADELALPKSTAGALIERVKKAAKANGGSADPIIPVTLVFTTQGVEAGRLPLDLVLSPEGEAERPKLARYQSRDDWLRAVRAVPTGRNPVKFSLKLPFATFAEFKVKPQSDRRSRRVGSQWVLTPNASWSEQLLGHLKEVRSLGYPVTCTLATADSDGAISFPVEKVAVIHDGLRHGLYLPFDSKPDLTGLRHAKPKTGSNILDRHQVNAELFWSNGVSHLVAPTTDPEIKRLAFSLRPRDEKALHEEIAAGKGAAGLPVIECKTNSYRFYLDVDLDHKLLGLLPELRMLKELQRAYFGGDGNLGYAGLRRLAGLMFPGAGQLPEVARSRRNANDSKEGHHLVFQKILLANDGVTGAVAVRQMESVAARAIIRENSAPLTVFLARMLIADAEATGRGSAPLSLHLRPRATAQSGVDSISQLIRLAVDGIVFGQHDDVMALSDRDSAALVRFALHSMGELSLSRHLDRLKATIGPSGRARALYALARRCRWEILRRARYFDHSVYGPTMGLRLLGTKKPGDGDSIYLPLTQRGALTPRTIARHSIRQHKDKPSQPSSEFASVLWHLGAKPGSSYNLARSLDGLLMGGGLEAEHRFADLAVTFTVGRRTGESVGNTVKLESIAANGSGKSLELPLDVTRKAAGLRLKPDAADAGRKIPLLPKLQELKPDGGPPLFAIPPRKGQTSVLYQTAQNATDWSNAVNVRVRVFIPSPIVGGPVGDDFGGDGRGPAYEGGSSRLELDLDIDLQSGAMRHQEYWSPTTSYDPDDTVEVPGMPDWWLDKVPGATHNDEDTLEVSADNVNVTSGPSGNGGTVVTVTYSGSNPLVFLAPPIDGVVVVTFNPDGSYDVDVSHDGFPAHTVYVNGQPAYEYDPVAAGKGPSSLFGDSDTEDSNHFPSIPPRPGGSQPGGSPDGGVDGDTPGGDAGPGDSGPGDSDPGDSGPGGTGPGGTGPGDSVPDDTGPGGSGPGEGGTEDGGAGNDQAGEAAGIVLPMDSYQNPDGSYTATAGDSEPETFTHYPEYGENGVWVGDAGTIILGDSDMFEGDVHIELEIDENGDLHVYFCSGGSCVEAKHYETYGH